MPLPGNAEPGAISGQQQQVQQQQSFNLFNAIPIKKRRFPIFQPASPPPEELPAVSELHDSKNKQESNISSSDAINTASPGNSDASKTSASIIKTEVTTTDTELGQSNVDIFASKPNEANPSVSFGPKDDLRSKTDVLSNDKILKPKVSENLGAQTKVKQEIVGGQTEGTGTLELSTGLMNVELSLGPKEATVPAFIHEKTSEAVCNKSDQSDPSLLSLSLSEEKLVLNDNNGGKTEATVTPVCSNRSNWDLNTTMDVWEGSTAKTNSCHNEKSSLTTAGNTVGLSLNKRKNIVDGRSSNPSNAFIQTNKQYTTDDSLGLGLAMSYRELDTIGKHTSLSDNFVSASVCSKLNLQPVVSTVNVNRPVKSEPVDENSKRDCSVGSCNSSTTGLLKLNSVKQESVNNLSALQSSIPPKKLVDCGSIKSELAQEDNQEARKRVMQHQDSCASSSALSVPTCSELTISRDLSNQSERYFNRKGLMPCKVGSSSVLDPEKCKLARVDEETIESSQCSVVAKQDKEKINIPAEMLEKDFFDSDCESKKKCVVDASIDEGENISDKQDEEYEDGEVREPIKYSAGEDPIVDGKKTESSVLSVDRNMNVSDFDGKDSITENHGKTRNTPNKDSVSVNYEPNGESNSLQKLSDNNLLDVRNDEKRSICVTPDTLLDLSGREYVEEYPGKEVSTERPIDGSHGIGAEVGEEGTDRVAKETCSRENDPKVEASFNGDDAEKDSSNISNRTRIINLSRASAVTSPCRTRSFPNRFLPSRSGKERCSDPDGEMQPRGNRNEFYNGGSNKFQKDRFYDHQAFRNSRPNFMRGKGRMSGRFNSVRNDWNSDHDFGSETSYSQSDYHAARRKHASDIDHDCNGYRSPQDGASNNNRRKTLNNDEFPSVRRPSLRRVSPGDRDGPMTRGNMQMVRRFPRNTSPSSDVMGPRHMRHLSDDVIDPIYSRPQPNTYDEPAGQMVRSNRNFSNVQRTGYNNRIRSKSPDRSRTRSPGIWSSPRRRSPNGVQELTQHRSPVMYRMGRMRSPPDRSCFRDEMVDRRRGGSPPYVAESSGRPSNSNRRGSPGRVFPRGSRRADALVEDGDEYMNGGPLHSNKFHGDGNIDNRRKFVDRRGPMRSFRQNYNNDGENFRFHMNDGPTRPFRFCPDQDPEFVERGNMREREFDGNVKHQPLVVNRRNRNIEEQQEGNYRPVERVWHDDEFTDDRMKRRRY